MLLKHFAVSAAFFSVACGVSVTAQAQKTGFFVGGAVGRLDYNIDTSPQATGGLNVTSKDEKETGWKVYGGYQFNKYIGVDVSYVGLGTFSAKGTTSGLPFTANVKTNGLALALVGTLPVSDNFAVFGRIGGIRTKSKATGTVSTVQITDSDYTNGSLVGVGLRYNFTPQFALRLEAERFGLGDGDSANFYSLGAQYTF